MRTQCAYFNRSPSFPSLDAADAPEVKFKSATVDGATTKSKVQMIDSAPCDMGCGAKGWPGAWGEADGCHRGRRAGERGGVVDRVRDERRGPR